MRNETEPSPEDIKAYRNPKKPQTEQKTCARCGWQFSLADTLAGEYGYVESLNEWLCDMCLAFDE